MADTDKLVRFETFINKFFTICRNLKRLVESKRMVSSKNIIYDAFENFVEVYEKIGAERTIVVFEEVYRQKKIPILSGNDGWIKNNFNIEYPRTKKSKRRYCIMASVYYRNASDLAQQAEKEIEEFNDDKNAENVFLPEEFIYPLLEIFLLVAPESDIPKLTTYRDTIKMELKDTEYVPNTAQIPGLGNMGNLGSILTSALGGLNLQDMAKSMGGEGSSGGGEGQPPDFGNLDNIGETISNILQNPNTKKVISQVMNSFKGMNSINDVQEKIGGILADTELHQSFKDLLPSPDPISDVEVNSMMAAAKEAHPDPEPGNSTSPDDIITLE